MTSTNTPATMVLGPFQDTMLQVNIRPSALKNKRFSSETPIYQAYFIAWPGLLRPYARFDRRPNESSHLPEEFHFLLLEFPSEVCPQI